MRDQYAGDLSDLLKLALLRALATDDKTIGVGWYYNSQHDGRYQDGRHREYCDDPTWKVVDSVLFEALRDLPGRSVKALEELQIWPSETRFHRAHIQLRNRQSWALGMKDSLQKASIVFLDPDNGIGCASERHATVAEVAAMRQPGRALVLIKFPGHTESHDTQIETYHGLLRDQAGAVSVITLRTCVCVAVVNKNGLPQRVPRIRWFTIIDADDCLIERAGRFARKLNGIENCKADIV